MAHNIFHTGAEWFGDKIDDAKDFVEDKVIDYKVDKYIDSFTDNFEGPKKMTPELEAAGWKLGLDNIPYNPNAGVLPAYSYLEPPKSTSAQTQNTNNTGGTSTEAVSGGVLQAQDLRQRTPSGTMYEPDLSEYRASSLFEYAGPGGLEEYTYGQGLPMDGAGYDIWGSPAGSLNPYYEGQFGEGYVQPTGPADGAVAMPPVTMPDGVPQIPPSSTNNPSMPAFTGSGTQGDLDYFQTLAAMGINPSDAPSTTFPGPNDKLAAETLLNQDVKKITSSGMDANFLNSNQGADIGLSDYNNDGRISQADLAIFEAAKAERFGLEADTIGLPGYTNNGTISQADQNIFNAAQAERFGLEKNTVGLPGYTNDGSISQADQNIFNAAKMSRMPNSSPNVYDTQYTPVQYQIGGEEQMYDANYNMPATDDGSFNYGGSINNQPNFEVANNIIGGSLPNNITRNPNQETQPYRGIYIDPRTVPEIDQVVSNQTFLPSFPADYGDGTNLVTTTDTPYADDVPIVAGGMNVNPTGDELDEMIKNAITLDLNIFNEPSGMSMPASLQDGGDEEATIFYNELKKEAMKNMAGTGYLGIDDYAKPAPPVPLSTNKDFFRQMYGESGGIDPSEHNPFFEALAKDAKTEVSVFEPQPYVPPRMNIDSYEYDGSYDPAPYSDAAIEAVVANTINRNKAAKVSKPKSSTSKSKTSTSKTKTSTPKYDSYRYVGGR
tara:strand:- start:1434 stop:3587 length:2154 start_codon:yes stop_codon:yes gene_type:complete